MSATIEIFQKPAEAFGLIPWSHLYIIYTKEDGQKYVLRAGPDYSGS